MNWKAEAMEKLHRYDAMRKSLVNIPAEVRRLEMEARMLRGAATDSTPVKGGGSRQEDMLLSNICHRQELRWRLKQAKSWVSMVESALSVLGPEDRLILMRLYIRPEKNASARLGEELGLESSTLYRRRDRALEQFTRALYGTAEA